MSYLSRVIPLARARSSSPLVCNPIANPSSGSSGTAVAARRARTPPLRSISPIAAILPGGSDHGFAGGSTRGYATALAGLRLDGTSDAPVARSAWGNKPPFARSLSDVAVPQPPTSNHPHTPVPGTSGQLIYTET